MQEVYRKSREYKQFVRAGLVICTLLLSATLSAAVSSKVAIENVRKEDRRMLVEMLKSGRNSVAIGKHDTLGIAYAIPTDSILGVTKDGSNRIYCRGVDGISAFRVRLYNQRAPNPPTPVGAIVGDTMVIGCGAWGDTTKNARTLTSALKWPSITCNIPLASSGGGFDQSAPAPACVDSARSVSGWKQGVPCAWLQFSATQIACFPLGTPRMDTVPILERD